MNCSAGSRSNSDATTHYLQKTQKGKTIISTLELRRETR